jgi:3'-5' exoribonuclease
MSEVNKNVEKLSYLAKELGVYSVCSEILENANFSFWSGSSQSFQHHYGRGGLAEHICEVVELCFLNRKYFIESEKNKHEGAELYQVDKAELFLAAFYHDVGKLYDYEPVTPYFQNKWKSTPHKRLIHHISRSAIMWSENSRKNKEIHMRYHDNVLHAILAHHGKREHGSPVAPKTRVAWLLCSCDVISARMYDADTLDVVAGEVKYGI